LPGPTLIEVSEIFLGSKMEPFTAQDFQSYLKKNKFKISLNEILSFLTSSEIVFPLVNERFLTYAGAFTGRWFSFKPTKEEIQGRFFIPGHRFIPFFDPTKRPYNAIVCFNNEEVEKTSGTVSMNTALDIHALYGEGYSIPILLEDPASNNIPFSSLQYGLPTTVTLTAFSLDPYIEAGLEFGDRILCRIIDWKNGIIDTKIKKEKHTSLKINFADMVQQDWYSDFEEGLLNKIDRHGPGRSIQQQLALLFLEDQGKLCTENCGSCEEFLQHTTKIGFSTYGIESRIWKIHENVPFVGPWNREAVNQLPFPILAQLSDETVLTCYIKDMIYKKESLDSAENLFKKVYPPMLTFTDMEKEFVMLHLEKRIDIVKKTFNRFNDFPFGGGRHEIICFFNRIMTLIARITTSNVPMEDLPQQDLVMLSQIADHVNGFLEELEGAPAQAEIELDDILASLRGMSDVFDGIEDEVIAAIKNLKNRR